MSAMKKFEKYLLGFLKYASLCLGVFFTTIPVIVCIFTAFKTEKEYASTNVMTFPKSWTNFENFIVAWKKANMLVAFRNTFIVLIVVLTGSVLIGAMLAYILSRFKFRGNGLIRNLFLFATLIPGIATQVTVYEIMYGLGLINKLYGYIIVMLGTDVISIYIFIQFFENIPKSLDESAIVDGCSYFGIFFKILFPLLRPAIVTVMILKGVGVYNEYYMANLYLHSKELVTVSTSLYIFTGPYGNQYNYITAGVLITMLPALIIFILCQKQIYSGLTMGAVKG
ncbi:MAG: multiple sugar transport system permease protein [Epulopiscium sp.]|jgi:multiple sugar transport system permease protein|uniref:ABC transporter permease subunit n=1 Tax=Defluviitalea raffinosedens TaxID=1450156 RepID=A0A7C8LEK9_9FIRM|nr:carbohydrate ABC transporter permease [Defluviitalea raffinosedens]MDK2788493.1 multiple sugar transport system permease protein [Candidatus Epulonipiscium sp.]KAE9634100.1 ABC transporter permease subunit [Defluviitalea raffinosedens]MBM7686804.1 multiple sugar transport system permease protein [Defluviitalea raffinosedens]NLK96839.1 carbohydrate ABC transporter permease [Candidatus Epulonipiscium sp.]HHW68044.1 carbohydrate ABC transporter permease [Candidatus Epulonipiscium sp.]